MGDSSLNSYRKKIGDGQVIGSRGEMFVGFLLSNFCLVRPVANGTDVGVDLYCEALIDGIPHSHFWVQVKTHKKKLPKSKSFEVRDLEYWSRQPIPVFIFLVSCEKMNLSSFQINVINLTEKFNAEPFIDPKTTKSKSLTCDSTLSSVANLRSFIFDQVPRTVARLYLRDGVLFNVRRTVHDSYEKKYEFNGMHKYSRVIMKVIGRTCALLMRDILYQGGEDTIKWRGQLAHILETYSEWGNYDFHYSLGLSKDVDEDYAGAIVCFERALHNVNTDGIIDKKTAATLRNQIEFRIRLCRSKLAKA